MNLKELSEYAKMELAKFTIDEILLIALSFDKSPDVRFQTLLNSKMPLSIMILMSANDSNKYVKDLAVAFVTRKLKNGKRR